MSAFVLSSLGFSFSGAASFLSLTGEGDVDRAGELGLDCASLDLDLDLEMFLVFLGVLDLLLASGGERDFV